MSRLFTSSLAFAILSLAAHFDNVAAACPPGAAPVRYVAQPSAVNRVVRSYVVAQSASTATQATAVVASTSASVAPSAAAIAPPQEANELTVGATIVASANFLGSEQGHVLLHFGSATIACEVAAWSESSATFKLPALGLQQPTAAMIDLVRPDGRLVRSFRVQLTTPPALAEIAEVTALAVTPSNVPAAPQQAAVTHDAELAVGAEAPAMEMASIVVQ